MHNYIYNFGSRKTHLHPSSFSKQKRKVGGASKKLITKSKIKLTTEGSKIVPDDTVSKQEEGGEMKIEEFEFNATPSDDDEER